MKTRSRKNAPHLRVWGMPPQKQQPHPLWEARRGFVPFAVVPGIAVLAAVLDGRGRVFPVALIGLALVVLLAARYGRDYLWYVAFAAWATGVTLVGTGGLMLPVLAVGWAAWAAWWLMRQQSRQRAGMAAVWDEFVGAPQRALPGSRLVNEMPAPRGGRRATILLPRGDMTYVNAMQASARVASAFEVTLSSITIEPDKSGKANRATLLKLPRPATDSPVKWKGPTLDMETGLLATGVYVDGEPCHYRMFQPGAGPVHDLVAGTTGAGKSRLVDLLLAESRAAQGYFVDWVIDPQMGQSLPDWMDQVDWFARGTFQGMALLQAAYDVMMHRNKILADRRQKGFTPTLEMPQLNITIEEAPTILEIPAARTLCEKIAKMGRKCGIKLRIIVQVPLLDQIGGSTTLRSMLISGNGYLFRTGDRLSGNVMFPGLPVDPYLIPRAMPDGSTTAGMHYAVGASVRNALSRAAYFEDVENWANAGSTTTLDALSAEGATQYNDRHNLPLDEDEAATWTRGASTSSTEGSSGGTVVAIRTTCKDLVLRVLRDAKHPMDQGEIAVAVGALQDYSPRMVRQALQELREAPNPEIVRAADDRYSLTTKGDQ